MAGFKTIPNPLRWILMLWPHEWAYFEGIFLAILKRYLDHKLYKTGPDSIMLKLSNVRLFKPRKAGAIRVITQRAVVGAVVEIRFRDSCL